MAEVVGPVTVEFTGDATGVIEAAQKGTAAIDTMMQTLQRSEAATSTGSKQLSQDIVGVGKSAEQTSGMLERYLGKAALVAAAWKTYRWGQAAVMEFSAAQDAADKFADVFGSVSKKAQLDTERLARDFDLAGSTAQKLMSDTGMMLQSFGFTEEQALGLSKTVTRLSADFASYSNAAGGVGQVSHAIGYSLMGMTRALRQVGIKIDEAEVKAQMKINSDKGIVYSSEQVAKAYAMIELIQAKGRKAMGDYSRDQDLLSNRLAAQAEAWKEVRQSSGDFIQQLLGLPEGMRLSTLLIRSMNEEVKKLDAGAVQTFFKSFYDYLEGDALTKRAFPFVGSLIDLVKTMRDVKDIEKIAAQSPWRSKSGDGAESAAADLEQVAQNMLDLQGAEESLTKSIAAAYFDQFTSVQKILELENRRLELEREYSELTDGDKKAENRAQLAEVESGIIRMQGEAQRSMEEGDFAELTTAEKIKKIAQDKVALMEKLDEAAGFPAAQDVILGEMKKAEVQIKTLSGKYVAEIQKAGKEAEPLKRTGAYERGSVEAYSIGLGLDESMSAVASNTQRTAEAVGNLKEFLATTGLTVRVVRGEEGELSLEY